MQYFSAIPSIASFGQVLGLLSDHSSSTPASKREWLDPICSIVSLALLNFEPAGTKLAFRGHRIIFDRPTSLGFQGAIRRVQGSSSHDLVNLTPALYYAAVWLKPHAHSRTRIIFEVAQMALEKMVAYTYADDLLIPQYLTTTHLKMIKMALSGTEIALEDFLLPDLSGNPLTQYSKDYWKASSSSLDIMCQTLQDASKSKIPDTSVLTLQLENAYKDQVAYQDMVRSGSEMRVLGKPLELAAASPSLVASAAAGLALTAELEAFLLETSREEAEEECSLERLKMPVALKMVPAGECGGDLAVPSKGKESFK